MSLSFCLGRSGFSLFGSPRIPSFSFGFASSKGSKDQGKVTPPSKATTTPPPKVTTPPPPPSPATPPFMGFGSRTKNKGLSLFEGLKQAPIRLYRIRGKYTTTLFNAAAYAGRIAEVDNDMKALQKLLKEDRYIKNCVTTTLLHNNERQDFVLQLGKRNLILGQKKMKLSPITGVFLIALNKRRRLSGLPRIINLWHTLVKAALKERDGTLTVAKELSPQEKEALLVEIKSKYFKPDDKLKFTFNVDPSLIDGYIVSAGFVKVDQSRKKQLEKVYKHIEGTISRFFDKKKLEFSQIK